VKNLTYVIILFFLFTNWEHSLIKGIRDVISVAWVASSIMTLENDMPLRYSLVDPTFVAQITWASEINFLIIENLTLAAF